MIGIPMFSQKGMSVAQAQEIYEKYDIAFVCNADKGKYHLDVEKRV